MQGAGEPIFETDFPPGEDMMATLRAEPYGKERFEMELAKDRAGETEVRYHPIMHLIANNFLRRVPDVTTPVCACGDVQETARHVAAYCQMEETIRRELPFAMRTHRDFDTEGGQPNSVAHAEAASGRIQSGRIQGGPPNRRQRRAGS
jgi:hypothetical protein